MNNPLNISAVEPIKPIFARLEKTKDIQAFCDEITPNFWKHVFDNSLFLKHIFIDEVKISDLIPEVATDQYYAIRDGAPDYPGDEACISVSPDFSMFRGERLMAGPRVKVPFGRFSSPVDLLSEGSEYDIESVLPSMREKAQKMADRLDDSIRHLLRESTFLSCNAHRASTLETPEGYVRVEDLEFPQHDPTFAELLVVPKHWELEGWIVSTGIYEGRARVVARTFHGLAIKNPHRVHRISEVS